MSAFTIFGLGEAGREIAADLAAAGADVSAYDVKEVDPVPGVTSVDTPEQAVQGADVVLALTAGRDSLVAASQALDAIPTSAAYADMATSAPARKVEIADLLAGRGVAFADVALMGTVPGRGIRTPALVSGEAAAAVADVLAGHGMPIEVIGPDPGAAAARKLLRSVAVKGLAAAIIESLRAAEAAGLASETWDNIVDQLVSADAAFVRRLVEATGAHAHRRRDEMEAAVELLDELGVSSVVTRSVVADLEAVERDGLPPLPGSGDDRR